MPRPPASLPAFFRSVLEHRELILRLAGREVGSRFRGSMLGLAWAVLTPLLTAAAFTFVFAGVFQSRWGGSGAPTEFALMMMTGLMVHGIFAEAVGRAPTLVLQNANYVTKVVFPLEALPVVSVLSTLVNAAILAAIIALGALLFRGAVPWTAVFLPVVLLPYLVFILALSLFLAAAGVFLRDISQVTSLAVMLAMFLTPIFYPLSAVPGAFQVAMRLNPLTSIVEQSRTVLLHGGLPDFLSLALYLLCALLSLAFAVWVFQRLRPGFADVL